MPNRTGSYGRLQLLIDALRTMNRVVVCFSGGSDSSFLLWVCAQILPAADLAAVTFWSATTPAWEVEAACTMARCLSVRHLLLPGPELQSESYLNNDLSRCYYCKRERFRFLEQNPEMIPGGYIIEGSVWDDLEDFRPGMRAVTEAGIRSPLLEASLSKADIATIAHDYGLDFIIRPSEACLATRIQAGCRITTELLQTLEKAEQSLHNLGYRQVRVRWGPDLVRLEFSPPELEKARAERERIESVLKGWGLSKISPQYSGYGDKGEGGDRDE